MQKPQSSICSSTMLRGLPLFLAVLLGVASARPCDIYKRAGMPCAAAHSTVRCLLESYNKGLYQVTRASDSRSLDITPLTAGGVVNAALQDEFCEDTTCTITVIYDQSGNKNHLTPAPAGGAKNTPDLPAVTGHHSILIKNQKAYGVRIEKGMGYRNNNTTGIPTGDEDQTIYTVLNGKRYNEGCCFDYGNAEIDNKDDGPGTMEAIYFGNSTQWGRGVDKGPWAMADIEDGLFGCADKVCPNLPPVKYKFLTAMLKGRSGGTFALKQGNAQAGGLITTYDGPRPKGYTVMKKQGAIILGIGGDNSNWAIGEFFEGCLVAGIPHSDIDNLVQTDIVSAQYDGDYI